MIAQQTFRLSHVCEPLVSSAEYPPLYKHDDQQAALTIHVASDNDIDDLASRETAVFGARDTRAMYTEWVKDARKLDCTQFLIVRQNGQFNFTVCLSLPGINTGLSLLHPPANAIYLDVEIPAPFPATITAAMERVVAFLHTFPEAAVLLWHIPEADDQAHQLACALHFSPVPSALLKPSARAKLLSPGHLYIHTEVCK
ncbi:hypothetical protein EGT74_06465 [Chitinophaga lutea]|uniref:Uncharacterized protein n=2 Tax=Chitinophaga lutea TaxID=2488634 RepID=A0A3N4QAZ9_9BACT|nr:hypothetical protein EGT74_06465 [Chitinophaga lutea]